jgi:hypothetical protein
MDRIILEKIGEVFKACQIIDSDHLKFFPLKQLPENRPPDSAKPIDSHLDDSLSAHTSSFSEMLNNGSHSGKTVKKSKRHSICLDCRVAYSKYHMRLRRPRLSRQRGKKTLLPQRSLRLERSVG